MTSLQQLKHSYTQNQTQIQTQTQNLTVTPQLRYAIHLLTIPHMEVRNYLQSALTENPFLEEINDYRYISANPKSSYTSTNTSTSYTKERLSFSYDRSLIESCATEETNLVKYLEWQLNSEHLSAEEKKLSQLIIYNLNEDGFLETPFQELIAQVELDPEDGNEILKLIQNLSPVGCGAETLQESLLIQAKHFYPNETVIHTLLQNNFLLWHQQRFADLAKIQDLSSEQIHQAKQIISSLHPKPGRQRSSDTTHYIIPDVYVKKEGDRFIIQINEEDFPRIKIQRELYKDLQQQKRSVENQATLHYCKNQLQAADFLINSLKKRRETLKNFTKALIELQRPFFSKGTDFLGPLMLKEVSTHIGIHESTASRIASNKYISTPHGTFSLKYFFSNRIKRRPSGASTGVAGALSSSSAISISDVQQLIKKIISHEYDDSPLSDQKIASIISKEYNIILARRTVANYREMLGISPSRERKKVNGLKFL